MLSKCVNINEHNEHEQFPLNEYTLKINFSIQNHKVQSVKKKEWKSLVEISIPSVDYIKIYY